MGNYLNPASGMFRRSLRSKIYVDKSDLIARTNEVIGTEQNCICVSRPRRFGKTMAVRMLTAYYSYGENADHLFRELKISHEPSYEEHRNRYDVILLNMQEFLSKSSTVADMLALYILIPDVPLSF